jgi:hypothetical protein
MNKTLFTNVDVHNTNLYLVILLEIEEVEPTIEIFIVAYGLKTPSSCH